MEDEIRIRSRAYKATVIIRHDPDFNDEYTMNVTFLFDDGIEAEVFNDENDTLSFISNEVTYS